MESSGALNFISYKIMEIFEDGVVVVCVCLWLIFFLNLPLIWKCIFILRKHSIYCNSLRSFWIPNCYFLFHHFKNCYLYLRRSSIKVTVTNVRYSPLKFDTNDSNLKYLVTIWSFLNFLYLMFWKIR